MITESQIYWITRLDYFRRFTGLGGSILVVFTGFFLAISIAALMDGEKVKWLVKLLTTVVTIGLISLIASLFIPTTKEMCAIKLIPLMSKDEQVQTLPKKFVNLADEWIEELRPDNKTEKGEQ
jgi:fumarate reductase subunit C